MTGINSLNAHGIARTYIHNAEGTQGSAARADRSSTSAQAAATADSVSLSDNARQLAAARHAVESSSDVREQKVADIKQQISTGTYTVSARVLARKMLDQQSQ